MSPLATILAVVSGLKGLLLHGGNKFIMNGEKINMSWAWLVYNKTKANTAELSGFIKWKNLLVNLKAHEKSPEHITQ